MTPPDPNHWVAFNQRHLTAAVAEVRAALELHAASRGAATAARPDAADPARPAPDDPRPAPAGLPPPALDGLCAAFGLSRFERDVLVLCAGVELDAAVAPLCAAAQGDPARPYPTFGLALAALPGGHWSALTPDAPLRGWRLVDVAAGPAVTLAPLRIDERILHHLAGVPYLDERLAALIEPPHADDAPPGTPAGDAGGGAAGGAGGDDLVPGHAAVAARVVRAWASARGRRVPPAVQLAGPDPADKRAVAAAACRAAGLRPAVLPADAVPANAADRDALARLWEREAVLGAWAVLIDADDADPADAARWDAVNRFIARARGPLLLTVRERRRIPHRPAVTFDIPRPTPAERRAVWHRALGPSVETDGGPGTATDTDALAPHIDRLAAQFALGPPGIRAAAAEAAAAAGPAADAAALGAAAWDACRARSRARLDGLAQRIESSAGWDDLVLPDAQGQVLREIATHVRHRGTVYEQWGFATKGARGLGTAALFWGPSGTGKTLAAEVVANELRLDLYRIDLSAVVNKYIGETEKNLRRVFDAAEESGAVLLFDEADALFGRRSEVKDSHDRYSNIEVSYLLQRMESYAGLAVLTTNLKTALDPAFLRRLRFAVPFPFPDAAQRAAIWRRAFPPRTPTDGVDVTKLARLNVAGGHIRNVAVGAAFRAAAAGEPVRMAHLLAAARAEYVKLEKPLTDAEIGGWV